MITISSLLPGKSIAISIYYIWKTSANVLKRSGVLLCFSIAVYIVTPLYSQDTGVVPVETSPVAEAVGNTRHDLNYFIQKARENNHQYKASQAKVRETGNLAEGETMVPEDPMFSVGLLNVPLSAFPAIDQNPMSAFGFMLSQKIALPGESESRKKMAVKESLARIEVSKDLELTLIYKVRQVYYELDYLYHKDSLLKESLGSLTGIVSVARAMVSVNKMNSAQLLKLEANLSQLQSQIESTSAMIYRAESAMEELTLLKGHFKSNPGMELNFQPYETLDNIAVPESFNVKTHPRYKVSSAFIEKQSARKENETAKYFPSLTFSAEYMIKDPISGQSTSGEDMISLRITAPLPLFFPLKQSKKIKAAEEGINEARENLAQTEASLVTSWEGESEVARRLLDVYKRYHTDTLPKYFASYKAMLGSLSSGRVSLLDVLDSYRAYLDVSLKEAEAYRDLQKSIAMLKYLSAEDLVSEDAKKHGVKK